MVMHIDKKSTCHSTDNKADYSVHNKAWMKITGPAAAPLGDVFFGSSVMVQAELTAAGREDEVKVQKVTADRRQIVEEHSVNVGVHNATWSAPQGQRAEGMKPKRASKVFIKGTDGVQKCIKVLRAYRVVLLGETGAGKSTLGNSILGEEVFEPGKTTDYQIQSKSAHERRITVLDTPGFSHFDQPEAELKDEIARCTARCRPGPHVLLIVLNVEESAKQQSAVIDKICQCLPEEAFKYAAVVFTHGPNLMTIEKYINENQHLKDLVMKCSGRYQVADHKNSPKGDENDSQVSQLISMMDKIVIENKGRCYTNETLQAHQRDKNNTKLSNPKHPNDDKKCNANNNLWISLSGPEGNLVAEAFFGSDVAVWQTTQTSTKTGECTTSKQGEYEVPRSEPKGRDEKYKSPSETNSTSMEEEEKNEKEREFDTETNEAPEKSDRRKETVRKESRGLWGFVTDLLGAVMGGLGAVATGLTGMIVGGLGAVATGLTGMIVGVLGAVGTGLTGMIVGVLGAVGTAITWVAKITAGILSLVAAAWFLTWVKKMHDKIIDFYEMIKKNIGVVLLVVAFYFLLFLSFCDRVPMAGTIFLSSGILVMFLVILLLFIVIVK
ncbi:immune-associated nucleotide-binding protein 12-like [Xiphophorus maculatus]|uniref:Immune-associated nucleotide-binding protein 12-like n=1 Tax=Xiphophorus maculatus TaxID=8083 RepID=A0A3B5PZ41_XIPMA|nr:immune-associated nucleotide-binding protein 12-like [Xiphophorus maculatus]